MPGHRLLSVVTAMLLAHGTDASAQDYSLDQLLRVESLILNRDANGLLQYFQNNPELLAGGDSFSQEMRGLKVQLESELRNQFRARPGRAQRGASSY